MIIARAQDVIHLVWKVVCICVCVCVTGVHSRSQFEPYIFACLLHTDVHVPSRHINIL